MSTVVVVLWAFGVASRAGVPGWLAVLSPLAVGPLLGATFGLIFGRLDGADIDDLGIHPVPGAPGVYAPWQRIEDLRTERVGGRTQVAVCFDTGLVARLGAPYDGRFLAADPAFERKLFMLRNVWETHRSFSRSQSDAIPYDGSAHGPDVTAYGPDVTAYGPDVTAYGPDVTAYGPELPRDGG